MSSTASPLRKRRTNRSLRPGLVWGLALACAWPTAVQARSPSPVQTTQTDTASSREAAQGGTPGVPVPQVPGLIPTTGPQQSAPAPTPAGPGSAQTGPDWADHVRTFVEQEESGEAASGQGLALYDSLSIAIEAARADLARAIESGDLARARGRDSVMLALYDVRDQLLGHLDNAARIRLFRLTRRGLQEVAGELEYFWLHSRYELMVARSAGNALAARLIDEPVGWVPEFLEVALAILIFLWWRRTGFPHLVAWGRRLLDIRPIRRQNVRIAKLIWYFERIHWPLEWLVFLAVIVNVTAARSFGPALFAWGVLEWILIGWTAVLFIDALAARGAVGRRDSGGLRRRSLWVVCWWIVAFALGRQLVRDFFGEGALFHWVSFGLMMLLIPVGLVLLRWWRDEVITRVDAHPNQSALTRWLSRSREGLRSYALTPLAGSYLLFDGSRRRALRFLAASDVGRKALAQLTRSELARQAVKEPVGVRGDPLPEDVRLQLLNGDARTITTVQRPYLDDLSELFTKQPGSVALLQGPRGSGKTSVARGLVERLEGRALLVPCPYRSFDALVTHVGRTLGHPGAAAEDLGTVLAERDHPIVIIDDLHHLCRPVIGGMDQVDRISSLTRAAGADVSWLYTVDESAWQYMRRFREVEPLHNHVITIDPWSEDDIGRLVAARCDAAGLTPDFSQLVLPRQLDDRSYETPAERNRVGFVRILWDDCGGNPGSAVRFWADSLVVSRSGRVVVRLSHPPTASDLDGMSPTAFFVLRTLIRLEEATPVEIDDCLPLDLDEVEDTLQFASTLGIVDECDGRLRLSPRWERAVHRALARRNMTVAPMTRGGSR